VSAFPTEPVPLSAVVSEPLTVSVTAFVISPVPRITLTIVFFTFSTRACIGTSLLKNDLVTEITEGGSNHGHHERILGLTVLGVKQKTRREGSM
jgi:hypothetical protein